MSFTINSGTFSYKGTIKFIKFFISNVVTLNDFLCIRVAMYDVKQFSPMNILFFQESIDSIKTTLIQRFHEGKSHIRFSSQFY